MGGSAQVGSAQGHTGTHKYLEAFWKLVNWDFVARNHGDQ